MKATTLFEIMLVGFVALATGVLIHSAGVATFGGVVVLFSLTINTVINAIKKLRS